MQVAEWRAQQRKIRGAAPGPLCRNLWTLGWFQPSFLSHPKYWSAGHKTAGYRRHPPFLLGCPLFPGTWSQSSFPRVGFESKWALTREAIMLTLGVVDEASATVLGLDGRRPRRPLRLSVRTTSLTIPTARHFWKRQNWQRFLLLLSTGQSLLARHTYFAFFCTVRLKKPLQPSQVRTP